MMRSLYSAISGLKNHQVKMDVIGNNIANVNTPGFKRSRVTFGTMLSQTLKGASSPNPADPTLPPVQGGTNAVQVGLGSMLGSIDQIMTQGSTQSTGKDTDLMLQGSGFFVLQNGGQRVFTRAGGFGLDSNGNMIDPSTGALLQGYVFTDDTTPPPTTSWDPATDTQFKTIQFQLGDQPFLHQQAGAGQMALTSFSIDQSGVITGVYSDGVKSETHRIAQIAVAKFPNDAGLQNVGGNFLTETNNSGTADINSPGSTGRATIVPGALEMSNVDLSQEFTDMIVTQRGFQANSRVITVSDTLLEELINLKRQ